jgi:Rps23 Pro-64 3,4-dihydroxylase Tpa1-like proline 4-hydroxylase
MQGVRKMLAHTSAVDANHYERLVELFGSRSYNKMALDLRQKFQVAKPFPHIVIDDFLPSDVADAIARAYPDPSDSSVKWKTHNNANTSRKFLEDVNFMSPIMQMFAQGLIGRQFLLFLETISGIDCLIGDPYFLGGGAMVSGKGDFLKIHADFNWHHKLQAHRRLNALFYLTPNWQAEWGGNLELWPKDMSAAGSAVPPLFNRVVIFAVTDDANHGQPKPLMTPPGVYRRVFSAFYYTTRQDDVEWNDPHFTLYKPEKSPYSMSLLQDYQRAAKVDSD